MKLLWSFDPQDSGYSDRSFIPQHAAGIALAPGFTRQRGLGRRFM